MQVEENKTAADLRRELAELKCRLREMEAAFYHYPLPICPGV